MFWLVSALAAWGLSTRGFNTLSQSDQTCAKQLGLVVWGGWRFFVLFCFLFLFYFIEPNFKTLNTILTLLQNYFFVTVNNHVRTTYYTNNIILTFTLLTKLTEFAIWLFFWSYLLTLRKQNKNKNTRYIHNNATCIKLTVYVTYITF